MFRTKWIWVNFLRCTGSTLDKLEAIALANRFYVLFFFTNESIRTIQFISEKVQDCGDDAQGIFETPLLRCRKNENVSLRHKKSCICSHSHGADIIFQKFKY